MFKRPHNSETCRMANGSNSASAAGGFMAQSGNNVPVTCRSSAGRRRTAASPSCQLEVSTPSGRCDFRKAGGQVPRDSTSFAAPKLPFVTSRTRPQVAIRKEATNDRPTTECGHRCNLSNRPFFRTARQPTPWPRIALRRSVGQTPHDREDWRSVPAFYPRPFVLKRR